MLLVLRKGIGGPTHCAISDHSSVLVSPTISRSTATAPLAWSQEPEGQPPCLNRQSSPRLCKSSHNSRSFWLSICTMWPLLSSCQQLAARCWSPQQTRREYSASRSNERTATAQYSL